MAELSGDAWAHCSACRKDIPFGKIHWVCSVSTCNRARTQLVFCSVACWDSHLATLRHREAWAVEARAPTRAEAAAGHGSAVNDYPEAAAPALASSEAPTQPLGPLRRIVSPGPPPGAVASVRASDDSGPIAAVAVLPLSPGFERDVLVVVSKLKKYIKDRSGLNTSDAVAEDLSDHVRAICDEAIRAAAADGRKTVLDRDIPRPRRS